MLGCTGSPLSVDGGARMDDVDAGIDTGDAADLDGGLADATLVPDASPDTGLTEMKRVLFVGNSYTQVNDLPSVVRELGAASGVRIETGMGFAGGYGPLTPTTGAADGVEIVSFSH